MTAQNLILPTDECRLEAGRKDYDYLLQHNVNHYGHDYGHPRREKFDVYASGVGEVMFAAKERGELLNCVIIRYPSVNFPDSGIVDDVVLRYFHLEALYVKKGQIVKARTPIGRVGNTVAGLKHTHVEADLDTKDYIYSPQVSKSCLYLKQGYRDYRDTSFNPKELFYIAVDQKFIPHPVDTFYGKQDIVTRKLPSEPAQPPVGQKLILPINDLYVSASMYSEAYKLDPKIKMTHYGVDMYSRSGKSYLYGCGDGEVLLCGYDNVFGNTVIVIYRDVYNHRTKKTQDVILRYFHMDKVCVTKGKKVTIDTLLGYYGNTGNYTTGRHLHISADYDTQYYNYEPGLAASSNLIKKGTAETMFNPMEVFHIKTSSPELQQITINQSTYGGKRYANDSDAELPVIQ